MFAEQKRYGNDPSVVVRTKTWAQPLKWQREAERTGLPRRLVFVCSWSDFFHTDADPWRDEAWEVIRRCPDLIFQILTKRPERIADHLPSLWGDGWENVWLGVSVEDQAAANDRLFDFWTFPALIRFVSCEPLLYRVDIEAAAYQADLLDWIILGGESGPRSRPIRLAWFKEILSWARLSGVPCFVKQLGAAWARENGARHPKGGDPSEWPKDLRVREFPEKGQTR